MFVEHKVEHSTFSAYLLVLTFKFHGDECSIAKCNGTNLRGNTKKGDSLEVAHVLLHLFSYEKHKPPNSLTETFFITAKREQNSFPSHDVF